MKSRIIVAGAGENNINTLLDEEHGVGVYAGNYGFAGGLEGYQGLYVFNQSFLDHIVYPGDPGNGTFGVGGLPAHYCGTDADYFFDSYAGSGGYYGSGAAGGREAGYWSPVGTSGGSSYISGHKHCSSITIDSTYSNIRHSKSEWHYSGLFFRDTQMIDGSGKEWVSTTAGNPVNMPNPNGGFYPISQGHPGNGFIKIKILQNKVCMTSICTKTFNLLPLLIVALTPK